MPPTPVESLFAVSRSGLSSRSKSAAAMLNGESPALNGVSPLNVGGAAAACPAHASARRTAIVPTPGLTSASVHGPTLMCLRP